MHDKVSDAMDQSSTDAYHKMSSAPVQAPSECPIDRGFSPFNDAYLDDPYPQLSHLAKHTPIFWSEKLGHLVVTGMQNVVHVLKHHELFSSANVQDPIFPICDAARAVLSETDYNPQAVMSNCQQPDHTRIRRHTREGFSSRRMQALEPYIRQTADELLRAMRHQGEAADFVSSFAHPLPGQVIFRFIGFPVQDDPKLIAWTSNRLMFTWGQPSADEQIEIATNMLKYWRYCRSFVADRQKHPADDFTSELLAVHAANPREISIREIESIVYGLSFAGHEIVSNFISLALINLQRDREHWASLCDDPALIPAALEEVLRYDSPQTSWRRVATQDTVLDGVAIPKGTRIFVSLASANRDAGVFEDADTLELLRTNAARHVSFGQGIHFCLGARLARLEGQIAIETLVKSMPDIRIEPQELDFSPNMTFRGPRTLQVRWDA